MEPPLHVGPGAKIPQASAISAQTRPKAEALHVIPGPWSHLAPAWPFLAGPSILPSDLSRAKGQVFDLAQGAS